MSDQKTVLTQEFARNPQPEVRIACGKCRRDFLLEEMLQERGGFSQPYQTVTEGYLKCPRCGTEKHSYYMTEDLRFRQTRLKKALDMWHETKAVTAWREYAKQQKHFHSLFDDAQKKYRKLFGKKKGKSA